MPPSRKRKRDLSDGAALSDQPFRKRPHYSPQPIPVEFPGVQHEVLSQYFSEVVTLRTYVLSELPATSRIRRKKIASIGVQKPEIIEISAVEQSVGILLDTVLVGLTEQPKRASDDRWEQWASFTQKGDESYVTLSDGLAGAAHSQSEIVDFVIWRLFSRSTASRKAPEHLLCDGYRKDKNHDRFHGSRGNQVLTIPGIFSAHPNPQVEALRQAPWPQLLKLLGKCGDRIMIDLLLDCAVFASLQGGQGNYRQLSGIPLPKIQPLSEDSLVRESERRDKAPSEITFVRNRMLYARAALNARGLVHFGLRHIHVLNRAPYTQPDTQADAHSGGDEQLVAKNLVNTRRVMMYMFPRQFGLHNVFTSAVDYKETAQRLKDYTLREQEISIKFGEREPRLPKRLKGIAKDLVQKLQVSHSRCSYSKLLLHYCPISTSSQLKSSSQVRHRATKRSTQNGIVRATQQQPLHKDLLVPDSNKTVQPSSIVELATPVSSVSAYCQAVIRKILPNGFLGKDHVLEHNRRMLLQRVDQFVRLRRFETMSLHEVTQGIKMTEIEWLATPQLMACKTSQTDIRKRAELFYEFLYYVFDSILIPLVRTNFYVTESNTDKYQLFFFRHDVWRYIAEPAMATLKVKMFEEVNLDDANRILDSRQLGFSQIRLLPKGITVRPIMNLRKKMSMKGDKKLLGQSINTLLRPVHTVLQLEKRLNPGKLGSAMSSVGDIYDRIKTFKPRMNSCLRRLYFAKVDVQSAFDTIPQSAIVGLLDSIPQRREYQLVKHIEVSNNFCNDFQKTAASTKFGKPRTKWISTAVKDKSALSLLDFIEKNQASRKKNTIFIEDVYKRDYETGSMLQLVAAHIQQNLVKIGKKYYRQKKGIPQGSVLSSILCNYFYADLETQVLKFLESDDCLLLRLIDDFLLVTTDEAKASRFIEVMHAGIPEYGVTVNPSKTVVNFDLVIDGVSVPKVASDAAVFPYCGTLINTSTLNIAKDRRDRFGAASIGTLSNRSIFNSLTVEYARVPGQTFHRKVLNAFRIQSHIMYFDTSLNSSVTMLSNLHGAFIETATKAWAYARCLPQSKRPAPGLVIRTLKKLTDVAFLLATSKARKVRYPGYVCDVRKTEVNWLAYSAFAEVLRRKQSNYGSVLKWLEGEINRLSSMNDVQKGRVSNITRGRA
ncbi:putative Telomerase reverse transcriptase [Seiridium cardinale]|uniref:Telomerase reverse transcriptase n=1 Tax=Seiridium cardinale TaxID=138064 RepID=A0ABR2XAA3_9PEZI